MVTTPASPSPEFQVPPINPIESKPAPVESISSLVDHHEALPNSETLTVEASGTSENSSPPEKLSDVLTAPVTPVTSVSAQPLANLVISGATPFFKVVAAIESKILGLFKNYLEIGR